MKNLLLLTVSLILLWAVPAGAAESGWKEIKTDQLKTMMETQDVLVVFPLSNIEYNDLHIKGSINIPMHELKETLPPDKDKKIVFYCLGRK